MRELTLLLPIVLMACGGASTTPVVEEVGGDAGSDATGDAAKTRPSSPVPQNHREVALSCAPAPLPPEPEIPDSGLGPGATITCKLHADCVAQPRGRCVFYPTSPPVDPGGTRCIYDECTTDYQCAPGATCVCNTLANACEQGNCRIDADCGTNEYCSPTVNGCGGFSGYYCHTADDACVDDADCGGFQACVFSGKWACRPVGCG
jgi:hypothetical protein